MSHAVRHVARRIARAVATSTPRTRTTPVAAEAGARPRAFSRGSPDGSSGIPGAPLGVAPPGAPSPPPGPRGPGGGGERRKGSYVSWPGIAFLIAAPVAYYLSGGPDDVGDEARRPVRASATKGSARKPPGQADAPKPERTKATTPKEETRTEATEEEEDVDVFRAAAELLARDLDPAPEGAEQRVDESKAERKERRRAEKRARRVADRGDESGASGPAGAARARALANQPDPSKDDKKEEDAVEAMTAAALVTRAFEGAVEENEEWSATYKAMVYQAEHDAAAFRKALAEVKSAADSELNRRTAELASAHASAAEAAASQIESLANEIERSEMRVAALVEELDRFGVEREAAETEAEELHKAELKQRLEEQAEAHALAIAECLVRERVARAEALDEVRVKLNGLKEAYDVNGAALRKSHDSVKLSLAVSALQSRVSNGEPFHEELDAVVAVVGSNAAMGVDDPGRALVHAVVGSIPESVARSGVPTAGSLRERLSGVRRAARRLSLVPETGGGIVTYLVAYLASWLRMSESDSMSVTSSVTSSGGGVEAAVASARANVAAGSLAAAAAALEEGTAGTAAGQAVAGWVADARERQRLEMAVSVLRSHAAAAAASLA